MILAFRHVGRGGMLYESVPGIFVELDQRPFAVWWEIDDFLDSRSNWTPTHDECQTGKFRKKRFKAPGRGHGEPG